jgi:hypothetical protein
LTFEYKNIWKTIKKHFKISRLKYARAYLRNGRYAPGAMLSIQNVQHSKFKLSQIKMGKSRDKVYNTSTIAYVVFFF